MTAATNEKLPGEWADQGACIGEDPAIWFPQRGEPIDLALAICARCPVRTQCLDHGLRYERHGVWGGASERERRRIRRARHIELVDNVAGHTLGATA